MSAKRQSNIECVRILAMFMILVIHANMVSLSHPSHLELIANPISVSFRYLIESMGLVGVDLFIIISGWFLINAKPLKYAALIFQILFIWGGYFIIEILLSLKAFSWKGLADVICFTRWDWFIKAYVVLMIISPVLNSFIKESSERQQRSVILAFFLFSSTYGWIGGARRFFVDGYGPLLFIGLYLLAHYVHNALDQKNGFMVPPIIYNLLSLNKHLDFVIFLICALTNTALGLAGLYFNINVSGYVFAYVNPFTIIGALYLFLFFFKTNIQYNRIINYLAAGSFAVYLVHSQVDIRTYFTYGVQSLFDAYNGLLCVLLLFLYLVAVYIISAIIDTPRIWLWNKIIKNKVK